MPSEATRETARRPPGRAARRDREKFRHPLARYVGRVLSGHRSPSQALGQVVGTKQADRWVQAMRGAVLRDASRDEARTLDELRDADGDVMRRMTALLLIVLGELDPDSRRACTRKLFQGFTYFDPHADGDGEWHERKYRPSPGGKGAGGLAARTGRSVRSVSRYLAVLEAIGIVKHWRADPDNFKDGSPCVSKRSGHTYACYWLQDEMPAELRRKLIHWGKKPAAAAASCKRKAPSDDLSAQHAALDALRDQPEPEPGTQAWIDWQAAQHTGPPAPS